MINTQVCFGAFIIFRIPLILVSFYLVEVDVLVAYIWCYNDLTIDVSFSSCLANYDGLLSLCMDFGAVQPN